MCLGVTGRWVLGWCCCTSSTNVHQGLVLVVCPVHSVWTNSKSKQHYTTVCLTWVSGFTRSGCSLASVFLNVWNIVHGQAAVLACFFPKKMQITLGMLLCSCKSKIVFCHWYNSLPEESNSSMSDVALQFRSSPVTRPNRHVCRLFLISHVRMESSSLKQ